MPAKRPPTDDSPPPRKRGRPKKPRGRGEGAIWYDAANHVWRGQLTVGWKLNDAGTRIRDRRTFAVATQDEAADRMLQLRVRRQSGRLGKAAAQRMLVAEYLASWQEGRRGTVRTRTHGKARWAITKHLLPTLGQLTLDALDAAAVRRCLAQAREAGLSPASLHILRSTLFLALQQAVDDGILPRNVVRDVKAIHVPKVEKHPLGPAEVERFLAAAAPEHFGPLFTVALYTGLRPGELLGLTWQALDEQRGLLWVRQSLERVRGGVAQLTRPKTEAGRRPVPLHPVALAALRDERARQAEWAQAPEWQATGLLFCTRRGTALYARNVTRAFKRILGHAHLSVTTRLYDTRHSAATIMAAEGVDAATLAALLGHTRAGFTLETYVTPSPAMHRAAIERLGNAVAPRRRAVGEEAAGA